MLVSFFSELGTFVFLYLQTLILSVSATLRSMEKEYAVQVYTFKVMALGTALSNSCKVIILFHLYILLNGN